MNIGTIVAILTRTRSSLKQSTLPTTCAACSYPEDPSGRSRLPILPQIASLGLLGLHYLPTSPQLQRLHDENRSHHCMSGPDCGDSACVGFASMSAETLLGSLLVGTAFHFAFDALAHHPLVKPEGGHFQWLDQALLSHQLA